MTLVTLTLDSYQKFIVLGGEHAALILAVIDFFDGAPTAVLVIFGALEDENS